MRSFGEKLEAADMDAAADFLADDVAWYEMARAEPTRGKTAVIERFFKGFGDFEIKATLHDAIANDEHGIQLMSVTASRRDGQTLEYRTAEIYHVRDGKITARWAFSDDTARVLAFFA
jgi:ketosteroid isomerase-like protein